MFKKPQRIQPQQGQESVWDYPRPPRLEKISAHIKIIFNETIIADTTGAYRVLETSHPPVYYLPPDDLAREYLTPTTGQSFCEWKGVAQYYDLTVNDKTINKVAWYYPQPTGEFADIANYVAFYPAPMDGCYVDEEKVTPQAGGFYGGWITSNIVGPFKGETGSWGW